MQSDSTVLCLLYFLLLSATLNIVEEMASHAIGISSKNISEAKLLLWECILM